jgi:hypothetical protein
MPESFSEAVLAEVQIIFLTVDGRRSTVDGGRYHQSGYSETIPEDL